MPFAGSPERQINFAINTPKQHRKTATMKAKNGKIGRAKKNFFARGGE
jgi:hypothetical protein